MAWKGTSLLSLMIRSTLTRTVPRIAGSSPRGLPSSYGTWERLIASSGGRIGFQFGDIGNGFDISNAYSNGSRAFSTKVNGDEGGDTDDSDVKVSVWSCGGVYIWIYIDILYHGTIRGLGQGNIWDIFEPFLSPF